MRDSLADPAADLHVALASVARTIAESLEVGERSHRSRQTCYDIAE
jgi:hypothetical protein